MSKKSKAQQEQFEKFLPTFLGDHDPRTPLHVDFAGNDGFVPAEVLDINDYYNDLTRFNAVGSRAVKSGKIIHLPVIDVDGGAQLQKVKNGTKVVLGVGYSGTHEPTSMLRDLLMDHDIDSEVFTVPAFSHGIMSGMSFNRMQPKALVLRSESPDAFEVIDSTSDGHHHLYIQENFSDTDHKTFIKELGTLGVIGPDWQKLVEQERMGIVRTPWTTKDYRHFSS